MNRAIRDHAIAHARVLMVLQGPYPPERGGGAEAQVRTLTRTMMQRGVQVAVLTRRPQGYFITHVEGAARPSVNGQSIGAAPHALKDHDVIELAGVKMEFFMKV